MSQQYLLDGYNIIKQTPALNRGTLERQRDALIAWINSSSPQGSRHNSVTVVFDGKEGVLGAASSYGVRVVFSRGQSADDVIKTMVEQYPHKKNVVVVSNDRDITLYVRALGASVLSVKDFLGSAPRKERVLSGQQKSAQASAQKYVSLSQQAKINKELEHIWIKKEK